MYQNPVHFAQDIIHGVTRAVTAHVPAAAALYEAKQERKAWNRLHGKDGEAKAGDARFTMGIPLLERRAQLGPLPHNAPAPSAKDFEAFSKAEPVHGKRLAIQEESELMARAVGLGCAIVGGSLTLAKTRFVPHVVGVAALSLFSGRWAGQKVSVWQHGTHAYDPSASHDAFYKWYCKHVEATTAPIESQLSPEQLAAYKRSPHAQISR